MRIIAGSARGRTFDAPKGTDTRPTLDRVKEAMFGMLQFEIPGADVLDLFSGSGNLGLEALSRGARSAVLNDASHGCVQIIRRNVEKLGFGGRTVVTELDYAACIERMRREGRSFRFAFLDAPYADGTAAKAAVGLIEGGLIEPGGRILLEHAYAMPPELPETVAVIEKTRKYGICAFSVIREADSR